MKCEDRKYLAISVLGYKQKYYINLLSSNANSKELIAFQPFTMRAKGYLLFPIWQVLFSNIIIIILVIILIFIIRKYCSVKQELKEIKGDNFPESINKIFR